MLCICLWRGAVKTVDKWCTTARTGVSKGFQVLVLINRENGGIRNCDKVNKFIKNMYQGR
jgi:3-deoxy-D-arabino-heptulosonate 7-phosphate (DAHP) synthase